MEGARLIRGALVWIVLAVPAWGDEVYPGIRYTCEDGYFTIHPAYAVNPAEPPVEAPGFLPQVHDPDLAVPKTVTSCEIGGAQLELSLIFRNTPRASGMCGAAVWARYRLARNGATVLTFGIGCFEDYFVVANDSGLSVCGALRHECRTAHWDDPGALPIED